MFDSGFILLALAFVLAPYVIALIALVRANRAEKTSLTLRDHLLTLRAALTAQAEDITALRQRLAGAPESPPTEAVADSPSIEETVSETADASFEEPPAPPVITPAAAAPQPSRWQKWAQGGLERQFGAVLPIWIGGIALAFAGFFLVKYSIENELIGPEMRVFLGVLLGMGLLAAARWTAARASIQESYRIAQSLAGAGIAVLYVAFYAASALYGIVSPFIGFLAMAGTTGLAVILALLHGPPIALLGLIGGMLTPALISSGEANAFLLFTYLFFVFAAIMILVRRQGWWLLSLPAIIGAFLWVLVWLFSSAFRPDETLWAGLFVLAVAATIVAASRQRYEEEAGAIASWRGMFSLRNQTILLNILTVAGALGIMAALAFNTTFGAQEWALFGLLSLGGVALAFFHPALYGFVPWAALAVNIIMLAGWFPETQTEFGVAALLFGALFVISGLLLMAASATPLLWAGLSAAGALGYFLLAFFRLTDWPVYTAPQPHPIDVAPSLEPVAPVAEAIRVSARAVPYVWGSIAMALALLFLGAALWAAKRMAPTVAKEYVLAVFALATTAFIALTFTVELEREFLSVAIAAELLAVAWVATRTDIAALRPIAGLLGLVFAFLLLPQILLLVQLAASAVLAIELPLQDSIPIVDFPTFQLALPAAFFLLAAYLLRQQKDGRLIRTLEYAFVALIALWGYYSTSRVFHPGENLLYAAPTFLEAGVITNVLFTYGIACLMLGRVYSRSAFLYSGALLCAIAVFRIVYFDLLLWNPLWNHIEIQGPPLFNALAVTFGLPILWCWIASHELAMAEHSRLQRLGRRINGLMLLFAFAWLNMEIRKLFSGSYLDGPSPADAELYSYSVAWLLFGVVLLFLGTLKGHQMMRYASLAVMLLTVTKVFLVDASDLTGLYRVFSFLGLGLSLFGLSYFYGRFVFAADPGSPGKPDDAPAPS